MSELTCDWITDRGTMCKRRATWKVQMRPPRHEALSDDTFFLCNQHAQMAERGTPTYAFVSASLLRPAPSEGTEESK